MTLSRREALAGGGALVIALALPRRARGQAPAAAAPAPADPNAFVRIGGDDRVRIVIKHIEFGQGTHTGLATVLADELDARWDQVDTVAAPANAKLYGNLKFGGIQGTGGSTAMASSFTVMRRAGAAARAMLVAAAANRWGVPVAEVEVAAGVVAHRPSGRRARFGELAEAAATMPVPTDPVLKVPARFTMIGGASPTPRVDSRAKSTGTTTFGIDLHEPDMLTVVVAHPPRFGGRVASFDAATALAVPGVVAVRPIPTGVAVYATSTWPALKARGLLRVTWDDEKAERRDSAAMEASFREKLAIPGHLVASSGDADGAIAAGGGRVLSVDYVFPYLAHAPMEPLDGVLVWHGDRATARFGCQLPTGDQQAIARVLGIPPAAVAIETLFAGGSFGRRAQPDSQFAVELAAVAKAIGPGRPVKLMWTREDDITGGYYRSMFAHRLTGLVRSGAIAAWSSRLVGQSTSALTPAFAAKLAGKPDPSMHEGASALLYDVGAFRCDVHVAVSPVPTMWWRSVGHSHTGYAVETFIDLLLEVAGRDAVAGRLALMAAQPRAAGALRAAAALSGWSPARHRAAAGGKARGVAVVESFGTYVAYVVEVSMGKDGVPRVHRVWAGVDCGIAVNPDIIRAQIESGVGYGLGAILYGEVPLVAGVPAARNFDTYRSLRIEEMPRVEVAIVPSTEPPTGIGEPGLPPIGPAVANAMARLGHARPARLPMVRAA